MIVGLIYKEAKGLKNYRDDKLFLILMLILLLIIIGMSFNNLRLLG